MKIWHVTNYFQPEFGYEEFYTSRDQSKKINVTVLTSNLIAKFSGFKKKDRIRKKGVSRIEKSLVVIRFGHLSEFYSDMLLSFSFILFLLFRKKPDLIHFHTITQSFTLIGSIIARIRKIPFVIDNHDFIFETHALKPDKINFKNIIKYLEFRIFRMPLIFLCLKLANKIIPMNHACKEYLFRYFYIKENEIYDGRLCVDQELFNYKKEKVQNKIPNIAFVGSMSLRKKINSYFELLTRIKEDQKSNLDFNFHFYIKATNKDFVEIDRMKQNCLFKNIYVHQNLNPKQLSKELNNIDCVFFLSNNSVSIIEAMAKGCYVIAADLQFSNIFSKFGYKINNGSIEESIEAIKYFINNQNSCLKSALNGSKHVIQNFSYNSYARDLINLYSDIIDKKL